jgi:hypothetical protein
MEMKKDNWKRRPKEIALGAEMEMTNFCNNDIIVKSRKVLFEIFRTISMFFIHFNFYGLDGIILCYFRNLFRQCKYPGNLNIAVIFYLMSCRFTYADLQCQNSWLQILDVQKNGNIL